MFNFSPGGITKFTRLCVGLQTKRAEEAQHVNRAQFYRISRIICSRYLVRLSKSVRTDDMVSQTFSDGM